MHRASLLLLALGIASVGCMPGGTVGGGIPAVFPSEARLGSTVALALDSNQVPFLEAHELNHLSRDNVQISIQDATGTDYVPVDIRVVFYGRAGPHSPFAQQRPGGWVAVALFDLPEDLGFTSYDPPPQVAIRIAYDGGPPDVIRSSAITITGAGGVPQEFYPPDTLLPDAPFEEALEPFPTLRIRPRDDAGAFAWQTGGSLVPIGAMELVVDYPSAALPSPGCLSNPRVATASDAEGATALLSDDPDAGSLKILLVDPTGFRLPKSPDFITPEANPYAGSGPILEIAFDKTCAFGPENFNIRKLLVSDTMGIVLLDERQQPSSLQHFALYTLADQ